MNETAATHKNTRASFFRPFLGRARNGLLMNMKKLLIIKKRLRLGICNLFGTWKMELGNSSKKKRVLLKVGLVVIALLLPLAIIITYRAMTARGAWAPTHREWAKRKQVTVTNNSTDSLASGTTVAITVDTKTLYDNGKLQDDCDDLRVLYSTDGTTWTELDRYVSPTAGATCATSEATKVYFPLQSALSNGSYSSYYYVYYANPQSTAPTGTIDAFDTSSANALLVCPFDGDTDCINSDGLEEPTTESGAIRYSGSKTALEFNRNVSNYVNAGSNSSLDNLNQFTWEFWLNTNPYDVSQRRILTKGSSKIYLSYGSSTMRIVGAVDTDGQDAISGCSAITPNEWVHVAMTYDDVGDRKIRIYLDGQEASYYIQPTTTGSLVDNSADNFCVSNCDGSTNELLDAAVDEVRISNIARYTENFTPQTTPFVRDPYTKLLLHFDEAGDDPRNTGKAIDDSGNGNHGTITGAKYVTGLVGVDNTTPGVGSGSPGVSEGYQDSQSYASHEGVFIEEGTTNLIKNPSFDHSTFNTLWSDEEDDSTVFNLATSSATFTPNMAKRNAPGPFTTAPIIQGDFDTSGTSDILSGAGTEIASSFYTTHDRNQGSIVFWVTPEWDGDDGIRHDFYSAGPSISKTDTDGLAMYLPTSGWSEEVDISSWTAGSTYLVVASWDTQNTINDTDYVRISVNNVHNFVETSQPSAGTGVTFRIGQNNGANAANAIIEGLTVYRRVLHDGSYGVDVGNGDEIEQIYGGGTSPQDPTLITGSWDVVFALPTDQSAGTLGTTGQAWSHPHSSNLLSNGFFMDDPVFNDWSLEGTPSATGSAATNQKIFAGGGYTTSDAANEGIYQDITVTAGDDWVVRGIAHSDGTCVPRMILYDQTGSAEIGHLDGTTTSTRADPDVLLFTGEAPASSTTLRVKLINTASSGTCYWHQVEVLSNRISNPSFDDGFQGTNPDIPDDWTNSGLDTGEGFEESTIVHSGNSSLGINNDTNLEGISLILSRTVGTYYSYGGFMYESSGGIYTYLNSSYSDQHDNSPASTLTAQGSYWEHYTAIVRGLSGGTDSIALSTQIFNGNSGYFDDFYMYELSAVTLNATPASEANSAEGWGIRVDGRDTLTQTISGLTTTQGTIRFRYTPRHSAADALNFIESTNVYIGEWYGDSDDYIQLYWSAANTITLAYSMAGTTGSDTWDATSAISAGTTYEFEVEYDTTADTLELNVDNENKISITLGASDAFGTAPTTAHWGKRNSGSDDRQADAVYSDPASNPGSGNITDTEETSAPYYKFGSKSAKLVAGANDLYTTRSMVTSGTTYTLSAYVYDGTEANVGGEVDNTVAQLVFEGSNISGTTYTDQGGGWYRLTYSVAATMTGVEHFGVYALSGKTIYVDGVQLEETYAGIHATTYTDGSLGTGYSWSETSHESTSSRSTSNMTYDNAFNSSDNTGAISLWVKPDWSGDNDPPIPENYPHLTYAKVGSGGFGWGNGFIIQTGVNYPTSSTTNQFAVVHFGTGSTDATVSTTPTKNNWYHLVYSWNGSSSILYVNNTASNTATFNTNTDDGKLSLGQVSYTKSPDSNISDVRTFDLPLSSAEVADLYYSGLVAHSEGIEVERHDDAKGQAPVAIWHFDDPSTGSGLAYDSSMYGNDLTISDATASGDLQSSNPRQMHLEFDGTNSYLYRAPDTDFAFDDDSFSVAGWFRHPSVISNIEYLISNYSSGSDYGGWKIYMNSSGQICFAIDDDASWTPDDSACSSNDYADSRWHHLQAVKSGTSSITLYIDGQEKASKPSLTAQNSLTNNANFYVGVDSDGTSNHWQGFLDEIVVYPYARSEDQVKTDATGGPHQTSAVFGAKEDFLSNGLVGYWKMDETLWDGTPYEVADSSGNGNHGTADCAGTCTEPTTGGGKFGNGGNFDGTDDFVSILDDPTHDFGTNNFTITAWFKTNIPSALGTILDKDWAGSAGMYYLMVNSSGAINVRLLDDNGDGIVDTQRGSGYNDDNFHHVVWVVNRNTQKSHIYVDGTQTGADIDISSVIADVNPANIISIGANIYGNYPLPGIIDEVRIYNRALSPSEVQQLYSWAPGPVSYHKLDENSGTASTFDSSGNGYTGTLTSIAQANWVPGKFGSALDLDGTADFVDVGTGPGLVNTISFWVNPDSTSEHFIDLNGSAYISASSGAVSATGFTTPTYYINGVATTSPTISADTWTHVAVTTATSLNASDYDIGRLEGTDFLDGTIDDVRIYNYARTPQQIVQDMNAGHPAPGSPVGSAIGHWSFDEGYGDTAYDSGTGGNNGDLAGSGTTCPTTGACPSWTSDGKFSKALDFDGSDDYLLLGTDSELGPTTDLTVSAWVKWESGASGSDFVYDSGDTVQQYWSFGIDSTSVLIFREDDAQSVLGKRIITKDEWHHIVVTKEGDIGNNVKLYLDGVLDNTGPVGSTVANGTKRIGVRKESTAWYDYFQGLIDEVQIFNSALTADQVKLLYNQGKSAVFGAVSTDSSNTPLYSSTSSYCPPGQSTACVDPVAEWTFDEKNGQYANDTSENNNTGTLGSGSSADSADPTWQSAASCHSGACLKFDGSDDYVFINDSDSISFTSSDNFSISAWVNVSNCTSDGIKFVEKKNPLVEYYNLQCYNTDNYARFSVRDTGFVSANAIGTTEINDGKWHHLYGIKNGNNTYIYVDGKIEGSDGGTFIGTWAGGDMRIGTSVDGGTRFVDGLIDDVKVYNYARTPAQIAWEYNQGGPVGHWRLDECSGDTAYDSSGNGNNGTIYANTGNSVGTCGGTAGDMWADGASGKISSSLSFDGTDDYVSLTDSSLFTLDSDNDYTWSFWIKPNGFTEWSTVWSQTIDTNDWLIFYAHTTTDVVWGPVTAGIGVGWSNTFAADHIETHSHSNILNQGVWSHITVIYNASESQKNRFTIFVNGVDQTDTGDRSSGGTIDNINPTDIRIGGNAVWSDEDYDGQIDDVRIYNYALTEAQIKLLYNNSSAVRFGP